MVSNFMPDVQVEIAFDSGYTTPAASRTWTDVSSYVELHQNMEIAVGRQDERSTADANDLSLTLDNTDGRFTAHRSASPYYPNVKIGRPIRVKATPPGGSTVTRFTGFIDEWPVEWDGSDAYARATIRASSRLARLGLGAKLLSMIEQEILSTSPVAYYTLSEPSGSTHASDTSGRGAAQLAPYNPSNVPNAPVFGNATGPGTDGLTALQYPAGSNPNCYPLRAGLSSQIRSLRVAATLPASGTDSIPLIEAGSGVNFLDVYLTSANVLTARHITSGASVSVTSSALAAGSYDIAVTCTAAGGLLLYANGALVASGVGVDLGTLTYVQVGGNAIRESVLSHAAAYSTELTPTQITAQSSAVLTGFSGDTTDERLVRILGWAGVASTEIDVETGSETMTYQETSGQSVTDALRDVESTEGGVLFDGTDGNVKFHSRSHRYLSTAAATLDMASQHVGSDYAPKLDRSTLVNDATVDNPTTGESARSVDTDSSDEYGIATASAKSVANSYDPLLQKANWLIASYAEPRNRVPSLTVDVLAHQGLTPSAQDLLALTVGDLLAVENAPTQADSTDTSYFVEGYTETIGPESYEITFNLSPTYPTSNVLILDSATRGLLDTGILAL